MAFCRRQESEAAIGVAGTIEGRRPVEVGRRNKQHPCRRALDAKKPSHLRVTRRRRPGANRDRGGKGVTTATAGSLIRRAAAL